MTEEAIERLARAQEAALDSSLRLLEPGGYLLYSTCSLEAEENEGVVGRVLERKPEVEVVAIPAPSGLSSAAGGACLRLFPDESTDGFTAHLLRRRD